MYENEAESFCGEQISLKQEVYLPKHKDEYFTFRQRVKELHTNHLLLYRDFIEKNYNIMDICERDMINIKSYINSYIDKYSNWITGREAPKCF